MLNRIKLGIFDHSGVLSDDRRPVYEANNFLRQKYGLESIGFEKWLAMANTSAGSYLRSQGVSVSEKELNDEYAQLYNEIVTRKNNPILPEMYEDAPGALRILRDDRGVKLAIVSSHPEVNLVRELNDYGIAHFFDKISGDPMPKDVRLRKICDFFGVSPRESFFVEDTIYGLRSGYQARVNTFGITTGYHSREMLEAENTAVKVVDSLTELAENVNTKN